MPQYFDNVEGLAHENITYSYKLFGEEYTLKSDAGVFSKDGLDDGSRLLLETIAKTDLGVEILDLGCGVGPIGLTLAKLDPRRQVTLADVNLRALECCKANAEALGVGERVRILQSDVYSNITTSFSTIVTNPPIRAGKKVVYHFFQLAYDRLQPGGVLYVVIQKKQGADSAFKELVRVFGNCETIGRQAGYHILRSER